jgi:small GTP-binding protein
MNHETITQLINQAAESGKLDLCEQQLSTFPLAVLELTALEELYLDSNQLADLPAEIAQLANLRVLSLTDNQLTLLPPTIVELKQLEWLYLANNQFESVPPEIPQLLDLKVISLDNNQINALPEELTRLTNLKVLSVYNNPLTSPSPEIIAQGTQAILIYLHQQAQQSQKQWAAKLLLVGEGGVGKTSLLHQLRGETFDNQEDSTHGIAVDTWALKHPTQADVTMQLKTWDFGGQTIYHATHQFFLTNRALFILVWNARLGYEQGKLSYWLNIIQAKAPKSSVLLVATHIDEHDADLPFADLKHKYPQIVGNQCYKVSNLTGVGVDTVRHAIADVAADLPLMGEKWPRHWLEAANAIREKTEKSLTPNQLQDFLAAFGLAADERVILSKWLHELGDLLYFPDNQDLKNVVILKPQWVTELMSRVLNSQQVIDTKGILTDEHRDTLWADLEHEMREHFSNLMEQFDLSYRASDDKHTSFIVERLPYEAPDYQATWDNISDAKEIRMTYELNTLPPGIPTWFIARSHRFTTNTHWRYGALFADNAARQHLGLIRAFPEEQRLELAVRGFFPHYFFAVLRDGLELTLQRFPGLQIKRKVPCLHNGQPCPNHYQFDYAYLEKAVKKNKMTVECQETLENVSVAGLLFGWDWRTQDILLQQMAELKTQVQVKARNLELIQHHLSHQFPDSQCPYLFTLSWQKPKLWRPFAVREVKLQLYCQCSGKPHPTTEGGCYYIPEFEKWVNVLAPHTSKLITLYNAIMSFVGTLWTIGYQKQLQHDLKFMKKLTQEFSHIEKIPEGATRRELCLLLKELDSSEHWGGLEPVHTPEGHVLWLCEEHARQYKSG